MIDEISIGTAQIPESAPGDPVVVVVPIAPAQVVDTYNVSLLLPTELPSADVAITSQTTSDVTLTVTRPDGYAGNPLTVFVLCINPIVLDSSWIDVTAFLDPGWTGLALLRKLDDIVYFWFDLTAAASIDGTAKTDNVGVLDVQSFDANFSPSTVGSLLGGCYTDGNYPMRVYSDFLETFIIQVEGAAGTTGNWSDGVSTLFGQVSWFAGS